MRSGFLSWGLCALSLYLTCTCVHVRGTDWVVDLNGDPAADDAFTSLQSALASDKVGNGDTLTLKPGTYVHDAELAVDKAVTIQGDGTGEAVLQHAGQPKKVSKTSKSTVWYDPDQYDYSVRVTADGVTFKNVTVGGWEKERTAFGWMLGVGASNLTLDTVSFPGLNVRNAVVVYDEVSGLTLRDCTFSGGYYESAVRGGSTGMVVENNLFGESHWYGGPMQIDDRHPVSGKIRYNFFTYDPGSASKADDFNQSGLGFDAIGLLTSKVSGELLIQHNTFAWESVDAINDYDNRVQTAAVHVKEFPGLKGANLNIKDNIFYGYQTVEKDDDHKKAPLTNVQGKHGGALDFDGEDDFATFTHPDLEFGEQGTLAFWVYLYDTSKRNTLLLGPQGEGYAARNERTSNDKAFEFQINDSGKAFFYPNYSDHISGGDALVLSDTAIEVPEEWRHLAYTWDKKANDGEGRIYLDGFEVEYKISSADPPAYRYDSDLSAKWLNAAITANGLFYLGRDPKDAEAGNPDKNRYLYGRIDDLAIFSKALNVGELGLIRQDTVATHMESFGDDVAAYWPLDDKSGYDLLDETGKVTLKLGRGWQGHGLIVPADAKVSNNLFFQNDVDSPHTLGLDNLSGDPLFLKSPGGVKAKYALQDGSPAAGAASDGSSNIGARQPDPQSVTFVVDDQPFAGKLYGDTIDLSATASSGLSVTFEVVADKSEGAGTLEGATLTITGAGGITLRATQAGNPNFHPADPVEIEFTAGKALLSVTADDVLRGLNGANPDFTYAYSGFLFEDTPSDIDTPPTATTTATSASPAGDYPITPAGGADNNYDFTYVEGTLTINGLLDQSITFPDVAALAYGDSVELAATAGSGLEVEYTVLTDQSTGEGTLNKNVLTATRVGEITVRATQMGDATHNPAVPVDKTFTITKRTLNVTAADTTRPYAESNPDFGWLVGKEDAGAAAETQSTGVTVGRSGDLYWTGTFEGALAFGDETFQSVGQPDLFLARYAADGTFAWARHAGKGVVDGNGSLAPSSIASDINGNVYVVGTFSGKVELGGQTLESQSAKDVFLLKYGETGGFLWAAQASGLNAGDQLRAAGAAVDSVGNTYVLGEFKGSIGFGGGTALKSEFGTTDLFLARFTVNGSPDWVKQIGGYAEDFGGGVTLDLEGQPVIAGTFQGSTKLDAAITLNATASREMFVAKYDTTGELLWSRQVGGGPDSTVEPLDLATGPAGAIGVTGSFQTDLVFGETTYASVGAADVFYTLYDTHGDLVHVDTFGSAGADVGAGIIKGAGGATYLAGTFQQSMELPGMEGSPLLPQGSGDVFVAKVDATGAVLWTRQSLGGGDNHLSDLAVDGSSHAYLAGSFQQTLALGDKSAEAGAPRAAFLAQIKRDIPWIALQYEGFLEGEDASVLDEAPVATADVTPEDDAGSEFPIRIVGGSDDNYDFEFTTGTFTVVKAAQAINFYQDFSNVQYKDVVPLTAVATSGLDITYKIVTGREIAFLPDASSLQVEGVGPIRLQADQPGNKNYLPALPVTREILVPQAKQTITWEQDYDDKVYGDTFDLLAQTNSGLRITYTVKQGAATFDGSRITLTAAGTLILEATQAGTFIWEAAPPVEHVIEVAKAKLSVRPTDSVRMVGEEDPAFTLNYTGFKLQDDVTVLDEEPTAYTETDADTLPGNYDILLKGGSDDNYAYEFINATMAVTEQQTQVLYFDQDFSGLTYGDTVTLAAFTDAGLPVQYAIEGGVGTLQGNQLLLGGAGEVVVRATQPGNTKYYPATDAVRKIPVGKRALQIFAKSAARKEGESNPDLTFTYSGFVNGDDEADLDALPRASTPATQTSPSGEYPIEMDGGFDDNYRFTLYDGVLTVLDNNKLDQVIDFTQDLSALRYGSVLELTATATSGLEVFYQIVTGSKVARVAGNKLTIFGVGEVVLRATQLGNETYNPALNVDRLFTIDPVPQTVAWTQILPALMYGTPVELTATATSGLPVQFRIASGEATYENGFLTPVGVGQLTVEAYQPGDEIHSTSNTVSKTFTVAKAPLTVRAGDVDRKVFLANPDLHLYYDSFRLGDTVEDLQKVPEAYTNANPGTPVGQYAIQIRPGESDNYELSYAEGVFTITSGDPQEITFKQKLDSVSVGDIVSFTAKASSKLEVRYRILAGTAMATWEEPGRLRITAPGEFSIEAFQPGDEEFEPADPVVRTFTVPKVPQTIFWEQELAGLHYGDTATLDAAASSTLTVRYSVKEGNAKIDGNQVTFTGAGRVVLQALQNGDLIYAQADPVESTFLIRPATLLAWPQETYRYVGKENPPFKILYDGFLFGDDEGLLEGLPRTDTPATLDSEVGEYPVNLFGGVSKNYSFKYLEGTLHVVEPGKKAQWIYFDQNLDGYHPDDFLRLEARTTSGLPATFEIIEGRHLLNLPEPGLLEFLETGSVMLRAVQPGNSEYYPAPSVTRTFTIEGFSQEILWDQDFSGATYADTLELTARTTSGLQIEYDLLQGDASLAANRLTLLSASQDIVLQARQPGNSRFAPAENVLKNFRVNKAPLQVIAKDATLTFLQWRKEAGLSRERSRLATTTPTSPA